MTTDAMTDMAAQAKSATADKVTLLERSRRAFREYQRKTAKLIDKHGLEYVTVFLLLVAIALISCGIAIATSFGIVILAVIPLVLWVLPAAPAFCLREDEEGYEMMPEEAFESAAREIIFKVAGLEAKERGHVHGVKEICWREKLDWTDGNWLMRMLELLSLGMSQTSVSRMSEYESLVHDTAKGATGEIISQMREEYEEGVSELSALVALWESASAAACVHLRVDEWEGAGEFAKVAELLCVDSMLGAYYAGVPIEDILA